MEQIEIVRLHTPSWAEFQRAVKLTNSRRISAADRVRIGAMLHYGVMAMGFEADRAQAESDAAGPGQPVGPAGAAWRRAVIDAAWPADAARRPRGQVVRFPTGRLL